MTVYLAGPMTGIPFFNFPAFFAAATDLRSKGFVVLSPAENDRDSLGVDCSHFPTGQFSDAGWSADRIAYHMRRALTWDVAAVCRSNAIALLPGWEASGGVGIELSVSRRLSLEEIIL